MGEDLVGTEIFVDLSERIGLAGLSARARDPAFGVDDEARRFHQALANERRDRE
jgi:hypothetical protein